jgi:hypothetical protein
MADIATNKLDRSKQTFEQLKKTDPTFPGIGQFQWILKNSNSKNINADLPVNK